MKFRFLTRAVAASLACASFGLGDNGIAATPAAAPLTAEAFAQLAALSSPKLSPDGTKLAAKVARNGEYYLMIVPLTGGTPALVPTSGNDLVSWNWVNNDWLLVKVGAEVPFGIGQEAYARRALGVSADGQKILPLLKNMKDIGQEGADIVWIARDGTPRVRLGVQRSIYISEPKFYPEVYEVDVSTGRSKLVLGSREGIFTWYGDADGNVRMGTGRMGIRTGGPRAIYRERDSEQFRDLAVTDGKDSAPTPVLFLPDGKTLTIEQDEKGFDSVFEYDPRAQKLGRKLYSSAGYDVGGIIPTPDGRGVAGYYVGDSEDGVKWVDPTMLALTKEVNSMVKGATGTILSTSKDLSKAVVDFSAADTPGAVFLYDRTDKSMRRLGLGNSAIGMAKLNPVRTIRYAARDGLSIEAVLTLPKGKSTNLPLIVLPHGGPYSHDTVSWDWITQFLAQKGYAVVQPNYRGSSGYGEAFTDKGKGEWGLKMQDDLNDAITHLAKTGVADPKRVCMVGGSYGGYAAMRAAERDGNLYRCAVSYAGVSNLTSMARRADRSLWGPRTAAWLKEQAPDLAAVSPINRPEKFSIPILIMHGAKDQRVPVDQSRSMASKLKASGRSVIYIEQPLADHFFSRSEDRLQFLKAMESFLAQHNPA
ncbi:S9 family peptidase [Sphingomonas rhizophila]|uniref:S9 family peptidase n=1 Tax=Sphingomonas rhizophila TaxID=2071607 RepID=A0A7G9SA41_9SPHN|nr:S9 family peptidase [Sphingomonas rhizophila]QNN64716.1 S9 family peptidase [Sphingomonas rhizophila]